MAENENKQENVVVEDFKRTNAKKSKKKFRHRQQNPVLAFYEDNKQYLLLFGVIVVALAAILVSILALKIPVVPVCLIIVLEAGIAVCLIVVLEAAMAVCLHDVPIWLHGLVVLVQIIAGAICGKLIFMVLCALVYVVGILSLKFIRE